MMRKRGNLWRWLATLGGMLGVGVAIALGFWQLDRAAQKQQRHLAMQAQAAAQPLDATGVQQALQAQAGDVQALLYRPVVLQGQWLPAHSIYLDNRQMQGRPGFYVFTPLQLGSGQAVLVQRGWIARNFQDRQALQAVQTPAGPVTVQGWLAGPPARLYELGDAQASDTQYPQIRQNLDLVAFAQASGLPLWPLTVVQTGAASEGLLRAWPQPGSGVATHHGYAFQWFAISAVLAVMVLWFQWLRPLRNVQASHVAQPD